jgi:HEAT repeat protein
MLRVISGCLLLVTAVLPSQAQEADPPPQRVASIAALPRAVRDEVEQLLSNDEGKRALAAASLGEMGASAAPALPWLFATVADTREVRSLRDGVVTVAFVAGRAMAAIGPQAVQYIVKKLDDPKTPWEERTVAIRALAIIQSPPTIDVLLRQIDLFDSPERQQGEALLLSEALTCFLPDPRVPPAYLQVAEFAERHKWPLDWYLVFFNASTSQKFKVVAEAREWWSVNKTTASLKPLPNKWCRNANMP